MAEKNQYLNQQLAKGTLLINENVLESIVINAVKEIDGVAGFSSRPAKDMINNIGKKNIGKSLVIYIDEDNQLHVNCSINLFYGENIINITKNVQAAISDALESTANAVVASVNVNVFGIVRK